MTNQKQDDPRYMHVIAQRLFGHLLNWFECVTNPEYRRTAWYENSDARYLDFYSESMCSYFDDIMYGGWIDYAPPLLGLSTDIVSKLRSFTDELDRFDKVFGQEAGNSPNVQELLEDSPAFQGLMAQGQDIFAMLKKEATTIKRIDETGY